LGAEEISIDYQLLNGQLLQELVVGNTVVGVTRQSQSLYMLYFLPDGYCELWKENRIYLGSWWIEKDPEDQQEYLRAFWPDYTSTQPGSLFSPQNRRYGQPTKVRYYFNPSTRALLLAGKTFQTPLVLVPGCAFPRDP
jgi:hypothetical protein